MAIRIIRTDDDPVLRKKSREVTDINQRVLTLLDDMKETMALADGVGLAAPQVGILKRIIVTDVEEEVIEYINPTIIHEEGEQCAIEGCLSLPDQSGRVIRPEKVRVQALNRKGEIFELDAEGLLARAICHEVDHLNGILFIDRALPEDDEDDQDDEITDASPVIERQ
ncbi:peptide deformylase [Anoxynatronum buryatiense]|uniref:Peptide deformylase n=1 Tax=Anoxynatronum buryatiense TaxID=489973 RepID=A0AA46AI63_9CLOT|nr:peptide deformylase [Anoxynatronum buryatiense]SMP46872.1 peptide deformylase [Anoxynatronum buryatiense]